MNRTQRLSRVLRRYASVLFGLSLFLLVLSPGMVFVPDFTLDFANHQLRLLDVDVFRFTPSHLGWMLRTLVWAELATNLATTVLSLGALIRLLHQFEAGTAFSLESVRLVRFLGWIQVAMAPVNFMWTLSVVAVTKALSTLVVSPWKQAIDPSLSSLFWGGVTLLVAYVLEEGFRLRSEQDLVI
jgi:hypothetical protein